MERSARLVARVAFAALAAATPLAAQIDVGRVGKYYEIDPAEPRFRIDEYPELSLDDLRKIAMYSKLSIRGSRVVVDDDEYMRSVETHPTDKSILVVTSDRFRFTTFRNAQVPLAELRAGERRQFGFLWIKHATKEKAPDGAPWLKDMLLVPLKGGKDLELAEPWSLSRDYYRRIGDRPHITPIFVTQVDPRPDIGEFPLPEQSVVGTFASGSNRFLVIDIFGGWSWWGKIGASEFVALRGKDQSAVDAFHGGPLGERRRSAAKWLEVQWANPRLQIVSHSILAQDRVEGNAIAEEVSKLFDTPVSREQASSFADLLRLEVDNGPVPAIDAAIVGFKTFGEVATWAIEHLRANNGPDTFDSWYGALDARFGRGDEASITAARAARYAFRRLGFPATIRGLDIGRSWRQPHCALQVYVPSADLVWVFDSEGAIVFRPSSAAFWGCPNLKGTRRGTVPLWDIHTGGGRYRVRRLLR